MKQNYNEEAAKWKARVSEIKTRFYFLKNLELIFIF